MNEKFLSALEDVLQIKRTEICLADKWKETAPKDLRGIPISEYLANVSEYMLIVFIISLTEA